MNAGNFANLDFASQLTARMVQRVQDGGTGRMNLTENRFLIGAGDEIDLTRVVPDGTVVGTTDIQTLRNKTIGTDNFVVASALASSTGQIGITANTPLAGWILTADSMHSASWKPPDSISANAETKTAVQAEPLGTTLAFPGVRAVILQAEFTAGTYCIAWRYSWSSTIAVRDFRADIVLDGSALQTHVQRPGNAASPQQRPVASFEYAELAAGAHEIEIVFGLGAGTEFEEITMRDAVISVQQIA